MYLPRCRNRNNKMNSLVQLNMQMAENVGKYKKHPKFTELNDLSSKKTGGKVLFSTDDWFAVAENLLKEESPEWKEGVFTEYGKWMDGWETKRKRTEGYDWCIIQLGVAGQIHGVDVDTSYFTGNYAPRCSIQAACLDKQFHGRKEGHLGTAASDTDLKMVDKIKSEDWEFVVPLSGLQPGYQTTCHNFFKCSSTKRYTHIRFNIYPDGGVARLRLYGKAVPDWSSVSPSQLIDLVAMRNGGVCVGYSDVHYGHARNLIQPGRAENGGQGWLTARQAARPAVLQANKQGTIRLPGTEWCVFKLGHPGIIKQIEIDTNHYRGNFPDTCCIEGCYVDETDKSQLSNPMENPLTTWKTLLPATKLKGSNQLFIDSSVICNIGVISHVRFTIAPDGGVSRLRLWGHKANKFSPKL